ncbi:MAG TPA: TIR domain-containing protein [Pyrinomonadaceae bacterium]|nr:TIR domain-containing protein [Pyrinomonadaceae bacterium]
MKKVFVSYSRNNLDVITQLVKDLQAVGTNTWHDQTLTGGQRWWDNILANIRDCDIFVFALSPESWESEACRSELGYVVQLGKPILPVLVADGINLNLLAAPLNEIQVTDYRLRDKEAAFALIRALNGVSAAPPLPDPLPATPPVPISYLGTLKERIDASGTLGAQEQSLLFLELEDAIDEGRSPTEIRELLLSLKRRDDLLARVATKVDAALKELDEKTALQLRKHDAQQRVDWSSAGLNRPEVNTVVAAPSLCPRCQIQVDPESLFCQRCGAPLKGARVPAGAPATPNSTGGNDIQKIPGSTTRRYVCEEANTLRLLHDLKSWLDSEGFDTQQVNADDESLLLQIKKRGAWRDYVGMSTTLNILFHQSTDTLTVEIGAGKWVDKAAAGTVSLFVLWPLAITAGMGAWEQMKLPDKIFDFIGARLACR